MLVEREPRLADLRLEVEAVRDSGEGRFCANKLWYGHFKLRMMKLVGDLAEREDLSFVLPKATILPTALCMICYHLVATRAAAIGGRRSR